MSELRRGLLGVASSMLLSSGKQPQVQQRLRTGPEELQVGATAQPHPVKHFSCRLDASRIITSHAFHSERLCMPFIFLADSHNA